MPTPYSHAGRLLAGLERRGMPVAEFAVAARLEGIEKASKTNLNCYFRDSLNMPNKVGENCVALWDDIERLCVAFEPLTLNLTDGHRVHKWVQDFREEKLRIAFASRQSAFIAGMLVGLSGK